MCWGGKCFGDTKLVAYTFHSFILELSVMVKHYIGGDSESIDDVLPDKLCDLLICDHCKQLGLNIRSSQSRPQQTLVVCELLVRFDEVYSPLRN